MYVSNKINRVQLHMIFVSYCTYVSNKLYINRCTCVDISTHVLPKVKIVFMFNFLKYRTQRYFFLSSNFIHIIVAFTSQSKQYKYI